MYLDVTVDDLVIEAAVTGLGAITQLGISFRVRTFAYVLNYLPTAR